MPGNPALLMRDVTFGYGSQPILRQFNLRVERGDFVSLVGRSGAGKTTIFRLLTGLLTLKAGEIRVLGAPPGPGRAGYMPQHDCLMPWRTALDNAAAGLEVTGTPRYEARRKALELWPQFGLNGAENRFPHQLSGGMRQRVAFLRTVLGGHDLLLLDEPFGALDALTRAQLQQWLLDLWERLGKTILFITHDAEEAVLLSDRVCVLNAGDPTSLEITLPRPRSYAMVTDPRLMAHRTAILREVGVC